MTEDEVTMTTEQFRNSPKGQEAVEEPKEPEQEADALAETEAPSEEKEEASEPSKEAELQGLTAEEVKLQADIEVRRQKVIQMRAERRLLKKEEEEAVKASSKDNLEDVDPTSIEVVKRVAKASGFLTKEEWEIQQYDTINAQQFDAFLTSHPEYKEENDLDGRNWNAFKQHLELYARPKNPHDMSKIYAKAQKDLDAARTPTSKPNPAKAKADEAKLKMARQGSGGSGAAPKTVTFNQTRYDYLIRMGWTEEEAKEQSAGK